MAYLVQAVMKTSWYDRSSNKSFPADVVVVAGSQGEACEKARHFLQRKHGRMALVKSVREVPVAKVGSYDRSTDFLRPWYELNILAFDVETTGFSPTEDRITEIGFAKFDLSQKNFVRAGTYLLNEGKEIPRKVVELTGITNEMIASKPTFKNLFFTNKELEEMFNWADILLAHNRGFDLGFLINTLTRNEIPLVLPPCVCSMELALNTDVGQPKNKLEVLGTILDVDLGSSHRAEDDARASGEVFLKLARQNHYFRRKGLSGKDLVEYFDFCQWPGDSE